MGGRPTFHLTREIWWRAIIEGDDQLRQRVAFALSEILVISDADKFDKRIRSFSFGLSNYYDILLRNSFGNYRELLEEVSLNPIMGAYLGHIGNKKANPEKNTFPDENYAREVLQLFSIGVHQLNPDGTLKRDSENNPIPTYGPDEIRAFARVFTGWIYYGSTNQDRPGANPQYIAGATVTPMITKEEDHDTGEKRLLNGEVLPAGQDTRTDLEAAMDNIFNHPNVGPFIGKQLIQRLVTSNPTAAYVRRVAAVFDNNGQGIRGDLKAVVTAILLDPEARTRHADSTHQGKLREPFLRISHLFRAFGVTHREKDCGRGTYRSYSIQSSEQPTTGQRMLQAPSVFNFFLPDFAPQGSISNLRLVAPEFQLFTENLAINTASLLNNRIMASDPRVSNLILDEEVTWAMNPEEMLDKLNIILLNGEMSAEILGIIIDHINSGTLPTNEDKKLRARLVDAIMLIVNSPDYLIQK